MAEPSKLPWTFNGDEDRRIIDADGNTLFCDVEYYPWCSSNQEDWELIVRAVNMYYAMYPNVAELGVNDA